MAQLGWLGMLHFGIMAIGSTLDLYGPDINKKLHSYWFNIGLVWARDQHEIVVCTKYWCGVYCVWKNTGVWRREVMHAKY
jgi:hypothetical protein